MKKDIIKVLNKIYSKIFGKIYWKDIGCIIIGTLTVAFCINVFLVPYKIIEGGVTGIAIILHYISGERLPVGLTAFTMTLPLFIAGFYVLGKSAGFSTIIATVLLSLFIDVISPISKAIVYRYFISPDEILNYPVIMLFYCVISGIILGTGYGIIYKTGASTGGSDLAAMIINKYLPKVTLGIIIIFLDGAVIILSGVVFKSFENTIYAVFRAFISAGVVDYILKCSRKQMKNGVNNSY
ncbi:MAG TPA: YitT family protein [Clostridiales bacterium]|nr:YitT family protein [Clostridiales bacterium]